MSKSISDDNLARYLDKWEQTVTYCSTYFETASEGAAAQHCADKVFYSPICNRLNEMRQDITILRNQFEVPGEPV